MTGNQFIGRFIARGDNIVSSHHSMAISKTKNKQKRGRTQTHTRPYTQVRSHEGVGRKKNTGVVVQSWRLPRTEERRATIQEYDDWKSTTERTLSVPCGLPCPFIMSHISSCLTVRFTFLFTTLVATRLCRCLLRSDYM